MVRMLPVPVTALPRVQDRMSFLYLEHCVVHREDGALTARNDQGTIRVPAASLVLSLDHKSRRQQRIV